jgi:magnesium-transporting ATPase (P-type)
LTFFFPVSLLLLALQKPPRDPDEQLITPWVFVRYMVVGAYVGCATVGVFVTWYLCDSFLGIDLSGVSVDLFAGMSGAECR